MTGLITVEPSGLVITSRFTGFQKYFAESQIPVLVVGSCGAAAGARQEYILQPDVFCAKYRLLPPQTFRVRDANEHVFVKLATMAAFP